MLSTQPTKPTLLEPRKRVPLVSYSYPNPGCGGMRVNGHCNTDVILIANCSLVGHSATCYDWGQNAERSGAAEVLRRHPGPPNASPNQKKFEMASIVRWVFLHQLMLDFQLTRVAFVDCDVHAYSDIAAIWRGNPTLWSADLALTGRNGAVSVWKRHALASSLARGARCSPS